MLRYFLLKIVFLIFLTFVSCSSQKGLVNAEVTNSESGEILKGPSVLGLEGKFVWGGSVVKGNDDRYHMFFSFWDCGPDSIPFTNSWILRSRIGYAVSKHPDRDFKVQPLVLGPELSQGTWNDQSVHNPHIQKFNGKYYLYFTGSSDIDGYPEISQRNRVQQQQRIGVIAFDDFESLMAGKFDRFPSPILSPRTRVKSGETVDPSPEGTVVLPDNLITVNPSVVFDPGTQKYLLYFKGNIYVPEWRGVHGVALSDSPVGPFKARDEVIFDIRMPDGSLASSEDPYVWYDQGKFFAVVKDFSGHISGIPKALALLTSMDGITWKQDADPLFMERKLFLRNGATLEVDRLERPQLLIENGRPIVLYAACSLGNTNEKIKGGSFNVQIPLPDKPIRE